ncbi:MAG: hypothetical protein J6A92_05630 [Lachnospiraceae bacterium]|nr:hypothetical protein [Lachnospiraceae bacterium]
MLQKFCKESLETLEACQTLKEYAEYVEQVRSFAKILPLQEAVEKAVDYCIQNNILTDFLKKNRAEAIEMSIFEYDEEKHLKNEREYGYERGNDAGLQEGVKLGEERLMKLIQIIMAEEKDVKKDEMLTRLFVDAEYREMLYKKYRMFFND